jgi:hypothetical protein
MTGVWDNVCNGCILTTVLDIFLDLCVASQEKWAGEWAI